jgi:hypothetical protein
MPVFQPGDWIKHRKSKTLYCVLHIRTDGRLFVRDLAGRERLLTRPEEFRKSSPRPDSKMGRGRTKRYGEEP